MKGRWHLVVLAVSMALAGSLAGQAADVPARVLVLGPDEPRFDQIVSGLRAGLREQGRGDAAVAIVAERVARGDRAGARAAVERAAQQGLGVAFAIGSELARVTRDAAPRLPIVFLTPGDPVGSGLVASLAKPGGNMTGVTSDYPELSGKRLEVLREVVPGVRSVLVLYDVADVSPRQAVAAAREAATRLGLRLIERGVKHRDEIPSALEELRSADALLGIPGGVPSGHYDEMIRAAHRARRPTMFHARGESTRDAVVTYGASEVSAARQAARLVDRILKGTPAGELAVERPTRVELTVNLKAARALGISVPTAVLVRADEVIQ